jgi:hypothetical protein
MLIAARSGELVVMDGGPVLEKSSVFTFQCGK